MVRRFWGEFGLGWRDWRRAAMRQVTEWYDVVVCGGGMAGFSAAVGAARQGVRVCLIQDRPVFGGNSSSEVRVVPNGAARYHAYGRETGIISEALIEERARNHEPTMENGGMSSVWDLALYDIAMNTPGLTFHLSATVTDVVFEGGGGAVNVMAELGLGYAHRKACNPGRRLAAVVCRLGNAETMVRVEGKVFIDATGDGLVADMAGCEWRMGSEGRDEFGEPHAPEKASPDTMGSSVHLRARDTGGASAFVPPSWAVKHEDADYFYKRGRGIGQMEAGYWWIEIGVPWNTIYEHPRITHELMRHALGVWDWIKNKDEELKKKGSERYALEWIGTVPGKRESRRIMGRYLMTEHDLINRPAFEDEVAFGGWYVDLHSPGGLLAEHSEPVQAGAADPAYAAKSYVGPYGIPLRAMISKDVDNLMMAGRNLSATHAALGSIRLISTCALMGQGAGTAAAVAVKAGVEVGKVEEDKARMGVVQEELLRAGCFLTTRGAKGTGDWARVAKVSASSEMVVSGAGPELAWVHGGVEWWRTRGAAGDELLGKKMAQWIAVGADRIETVWVCLSNGSGKGQRVKAGLVKVESIWDYRGSGAGAIADTTLEVPAGEKVWVAWKVGAKVEKGTYVRLDLEGNEAVAWHSAGGLLPGHVSALEFAPGYLRRYRGGVTLAFKVEPEQRSFGAEQVVSGVTRPHRYTNSWRSDPKEGLPAWVELAWDEAVRVGQVELTFAGYLLLEHRASPRFYRDPQCVRDYCLQVVREGAGEWETVAEVKGNYQRRRVHEIAGGVTARKVRVVVTATNGDAAAAIYEMRCYT